MWRQIYGRKFHISLTSGEMSKEVDKPIVNQMLQINKPTETIGNIPT